LRNAIFRISCLATDVADLEHLPDHIRPAGIDKTDKGPAEQTAASLADAKRMASDDAEKRFLQESLSKVNGKVTALAAAIGMNRSHLQTLLKKHGLTRSMMAQSDEASEKRPKSKAAAT
jgi:DNA-binding NtrC family response regulator